MSRILQYPSTTPLQVWNNAAFDGEELQGFSFPMKPSWSSADCSKENLSPAALNSTPIPATANNKTSFDQQQDDKSIDHEIQQIESEIQRLSSRLESLRLRKAAKTAERRGRIVPAKFMETKQGGTCVKVIEETPKAAKVGMMRRGMSLGPAEISAGGGKTFSRWPGKASVGGNTITPVRSAAAATTMQSRRKSCFWKLDDVDEMKGIMSERKKKTLSLSPKSKRNVVVPPKQSAATVAAGTRKSVKKEEGIAALVQPRKLLFKEGEKSVGNSKRQVKPGGRMVASRYTQTAAAVVDAARKRSFPENDDDNSGKRPASLLRGSGQGSEVVRVKKRWEIPPQAEVVLQQSAAAADHKSGVLALPKIRTVRRYPPNYESPRDSGAAKRVSDLSGKRSYFCPDDDEEEESVCQVLSFAQDDDANDEEF